MMINGMAHGGLRGTTVCQLHMRHFKDGDTIIIEPWRARAFPVLKDLVDRPQRLRPHHSGRRIRLRQHRRRARRQRPARRQDRRRPGDGRRRVHWLRRLRGRVQERLRHAFRGRQGLASGLAAAGQTRARAARAQHGPDDGRSRLRQLHRDRLLRSRLPQGNQLWISSPG